MKTEAFGMIRVIHSVGKGWGAYMVSDASAPFLPTRSPRLTRVGPHCRSRASAERIAERIMAAQGKTLRLVPNKI